MTKVIVKFSCVYLDSFWQRVELIETIRINEKGLFRPFFASAFFLAVVRQIICKGKRTIQLQIDKF